VPVAERRLDVFLSPGEVVPGELAGRTAVVIDVLRASTSIVEALAAGARTIFPVASVEEATRLANTLGRGEVLLCGERRYLPIEGFDLGNSPAEFTAERVGGKTLVMTTTNGTAALVNAQPADRVMVAAFTNLTAVAADLAKSRAEPVLICCGREGRFGLEDAVCAGRLILALQARQPKVSWAMNDGARAAVVLSQTKEELRAVFARSTAGLQIVEVGLEPDLDFCAAVDARDVVPVLHDRQITLPTVVVPEVP
jgi:2-phosphosulfolactate phosphatase